MLYFMIQVTSSYKHRLQHHCFFIVCGLARSLRGALSGGQALNQTKEWEAVVVKLGKANYDDRVKFHQDHFHRRI